MSFKNYLNKYTTTCKLPGLEEELEIKPLTTGEMKKTLIHQNETDPRKIEEIIDTLISDSVLTSDFDINNVYLQDRYFLLIEIRKITKGNKYTFQFTCPQCQSQSITGIDLGELEVKTKPKNVDNIIYVAGDELSVELDHVKRGEQKDAHNKIDLSSVTNEDERDAELLLSTLAAGIKAVNSPDGREENLNFEDKKYIIENITGDSLDKIRQWYTDNWFGVNAVMKAKCQHCNYVTDEQPIEISSNFF